jgi:hypothetical protein
MKRIVTLIGLALIVQACKSDKSESLKESSDVVELTVANKIANRYGFENWSDVETIKFTFNVNKDSSHFERSWEWNPKTNDVVLKSSTDTLRYNRSKIDSTFIYADKAFINDKYWLLTPFNLVWDSGTTLSNPEKETAPLSKKLLNKITLTYNNEGGYTPGDAYDFYYNDDYIIEEWVYRKGNSEAPSMMTTWENNKDLNGILIPMSYKKTEDNWELVFTNVSIE